MRANGPWAGLVRQPCSLTAVEEKWSVQTGVVGEQTGNQSLVPSYSLHVCV